MSSHFATSFSSAAAGKDSGTSNHSGASSTTGSGGGSNSVDWTRRVNGSSTSSTTRRPSLSTTLTHSNTPLISSSSNVYHPPHHYNRQTTAQNTSYGKDELLNIFRSQEGGGNLGKRLPELLDGDFSASSSTSGGWGRSGEDSLNGVDLCWEKEGGVKPIGLEEMSEEERELFSGNVNSTHKISNNNQGTVNHHNSTPPQNRGKTVGGTGATPGTNRPTTRRRETSDAAAGGNPFGATPPQISRRRTDLRDGDDASSPRDRTFFGRWGSTSGPPGEEENKEKEEGSGGTIGRNTGLFRRGSAAWGGSGNSATGFTSNSALNSPMGTFGNGTFGGGAMGGFTLQSGEKSKPANSAGGPKARPGVEDVDERAEDEDLHKVVSNAVNDYDEEDPRERPTTSDTDPFGLGGRDDHPQQEQRDPTPGIMDQQQRNMKTASPFGGISISTSNAPKGQGIISTPIRTRQDLGFSSFGGSREGLGGVVPGMTGLQHQLQNLQFNDRGQVPLRQSREGSIGGALAGDNEPLSPAETNPFMSPPPEKADEENMSNEHNEGGGLGSVIAGLRRGETGNIGHPGSDRSGRSSTAGLGSVGGPLGGGFGGLGSSGLWSSGQIGTPIGTSAAQGSFFGGGTQLGDISSPGGPGNGSLLSGGLGGLGGNTGFGSASRASRLGQLFPENMQHQDDNQGFEADTFGNDPRFNAFGSRRGLGGAIDSPMRERGDVADLFGFPNTRSLTNLAGTAAAQENSLYHRDSADPLGIGQTHQNQGSPPQLGPTGQPGQPLRPPPGTLPSSQQHVMIMPDKINWVYRDPSGTIQGPFSGLEMHEWYRAGFFTQELAVKRVEDNEFEQLGLLVRKIGNTREPFLVPLPGNTSGMSTNNASANWSESWLNEMPGAQQVQAAAQAQTPGGMQPPFAGSFPTFGTTLTAEQQNALERRKQEEQYLMAKQREFLLQQQIMAKQAAVLHHQSSTQSLHSQPSFGSLHSPSGFAPATTPAAAAGVVGGQNAFEPGVLLRQAGAAAGGVDSLNMGGQMGGMQTPGGQFPQQDQVMQMQQQRIAEQQRQQLYRSEQTQHVQKQLQNAQEQAQQAHLKQQYETEQYDNQSEASLREQQHAQEILDQENIEEPEQPEPKALTPAPQEQPKVKIPKAPAAIKTSPAPKPSQAVWGQVAPLVQPFPPPPTQESPQLGVSPSAETPSASVAPWAKEEAQPIKGPSLKEIQELEAKQAAAREAAEAQTRREHLAQQSTHQPPPPAPGLPSTATWATSPSTTPAVGASAWSKPLAKAAPKSGAQQTLAQIQKEEEVRKAKLAAQASQAAVIGITNPIIATAGRGYAGVASKSPNPLQPMGTGAWTTVGPGGKSKGLGGPTAIPTAIPTAPGQAVKATSGVFLAIAAPKKAAPAASPAKPVTTSAQDEFMKWCRASLKGLNPGVTPDSVIDTVGAFPSDSEIIADTIYTVSNTMDGRRWADEYIKRREAAGNGVVMDAGTNSGNGNGNGSGWNEVAKGRPTTITTTTTGVPETNNAFRVVAGKKKGRRA